MVNALNFGHILLGPDNRDGLMANFTPCGSPQLPQLSPIPLWPPGFGKDSFTMDHPWTIYGNFLHRDEHDMYMFAPTIHWLNLLNDQKSASLQTRPAIQLWMWFWSSRLPDLFAVLSMSSFREAGIPQRPFRSGQENRNIVLHNLVCLYWIFWVDHV